MTSLRLFLNVFLCLGLAAGINGKIINCYFGTWANWRPGNGRFTPENIDANLCTHLSYSFFGITDAGAFKQLDSWLDFEVGFISRTMALKKTNPNLKVLAVVGGWNEGSVKYSQMAADSNKRKNFIQTTLNFIRQYGFDGLDLDWEYPVQRGGLAADKQNFVTLLKELKEELGRYNLELGIAVGASADTATISYDIPNIAKHVDFINVMTYDLQPRNILGFNAPLRGQGEHNVEACINYWLQKGVPASKLILGLAFYGRSYTLSNNQNTIPGSASSGAGAAGPFTRENGFLGYNEICSNAPTWTKVFDNVHSVPYMFRDNQWVGYDDVQSINLKLDFMNSKNLGGAMLWSIETDDFLGQCGEKYPLLKAINKKVATNTGNPTTTTQRPPTVSSTTSKPTVKPPPSTNCANDGFYADPNDCNKFYRCVNGVRYAFTCPAGLLFDKNSSNCLWPHEAICY
uniref:chitinase n=1 Tax=Stomoxys calcitrans TaxID=35570 RepID=A0A1I8QE20_STOCA